MKLIKRIRYQRVAYKDLDDDDRVKHIFSPGGWAHKSDLSSDPDHKCVMVDLDKYPPNVTWDIVGIPDEEVWHVDVWYEVFSGFGAAFDEFEEVYE